MARAKELINAADKSAGVLRVYTKKRGTDTVKIVYNTQTKELAMATQEGDVMNTLFRPGADKAPDLATFHKEAEDYIKKTSQAEGWTEVLQ